MRVEDLLGLDHSNIQETTELKAIIQTFNFNISNTLKQLNDLSHIRDKSLMESQSLVNKMNVMKQQNQKKAKNFQQAIQESFINYNKKKQEINDNHNGWVKNSELKYEQIMDGLVQKITLLKQQHFKMNDNEIEQIQYLDQIKQKSSNLIKIQYQHHDQMNKEEQQQVNENRDLFLKNKQLIKELKKDVKMEACRFVYNQKYKNDDKNYELKAKLFQLQDEVSRLRKQRNETLKNRKQHKINTSLNEQEIQEYKAVGSIQKSKIKMYNDKVESLKKTIQTQIRKFQSKISEKKSKWQNQLKSSKFKLINLQKNKEQLKINLQRYKILGQTILMQRQEIQQFFLMAIESCKKEMSQTGALIESTQKQYGEKVDIEELQPKDRHRIITNLYTKLALAATK